MYNVGIIGCGGIADMHQEGFAATGRARVSRVFDTNPETARDRARQWGAQTCTSGEELAAANDVDIVVIATPGFARLDYLRAATEARKPILSEKPIALSLPDAEQIRTMVDGAGCLFMVNFTQRFNPPLATLRQVQEDGRLGGTVSAWARLHAPTPTARWLEIVQSGHWRASQELSGGRINEFCSHTVNWLLWVLGKPKTIYGRAMIVTEGFNLDDADYALLECERGTGLLEVNRHAGVAPEENYGIMGHAGSVVLKDGEIRLTAMDRDPVGLPTLPNVPSAHEHFLDCLASGNQPRNGIDDAIDTLRTCLAFNRSAASGQVEKV
jgi:myo-inositol 2-dehydrogenase/D-chiro-inositol 1-dehydrogenase